MNYVSQENIDNIVKGMSRKLLESVANSAVIGDTTPVGTIISFMGTQAPDFYLICDGTTYNIAEYQELADFIEFQFGSKNYFGGDGITTFAVPDLQGEFLRGTGTNSHENQGNGGSVGVHQDGTIFNNVLGYSDNRVYATESSDISGSTRNHDNNISNSSQFVYSSAGGTVSGGVQYTSRPTNTSVLYCIKYTKAVIPSEYEDGTPVGRIVFDYILRDGYIKANGAQVEDASINIPRLLAFVQQYSSQILAPDQATYEANIGLYLYDSTNDILTLPNYIGRFVEGGNSITSIEAGLPNIKGNFIMKTETTGASIGAFSDWGETGHAYVEGNNSGIIGYSFDASQSNSIYSDTVNTVQPPAIKMIPQIRY